MEGGGTVYLYGPTGNQCPTLAMSIDDCPFASLIQAMPIKAHALEGPRDRRTTVLDTAILLHELGKVTCVVFKAISC